MIAELSRVFINRARNTEDTAKVYFEKYQCKLNVCYTLCNAFCDIQLQFLMYK